MNRPNKFSFIPNLTLHLFICVIATIAYTQNPSIQSISNISYTYAHSNELIGKYIVIKGYPQTIIRVSVLLSGPGNTCSGTVEDGFLILTEFPNSETQNPVNSSVLFPDGIQIDRYNCSGNECSFTCFPITETGVEKFAFYGRLEQTQTEFGVTVQLGEET